MVKYWKLLLNRDINLRKIKKIFFIIIFYCQSSASVSFGGNNLLCEGKYQTFGYEFIDNVNVIRHAGSFEENDYYKNSGTYSIAKDNINLDIEGDLFPRTIKKNTLELFIGVHFNNTLVCRCKKFDGNFNDFFKKLL